MGDQNKAGNGGDSAQTKKQELAEQHIEKIVLEKHQLTVDKFPIANRLLDEELQTTKQTGRAAYNDRYIDVYNEKPIKVLTRVLFPTKDVPSFNFVGKLLGPKGSTLQLLQEETRCKMFIFGRGSMRNAEKEEQLRQSGDPKTAHLSDELHVEVSCVAPPAEAYGRMAHALKRLKSVLVPDPPGEGFFPYEEEHPSWSRGGIPPLIDTKSKVMGLLHRARQSMEYQPPMPPPPQRRRFGPPAPRDAYDGYEENFHRRGEGFYPPRPAPYPRMPRY